MKTNIKKETEKALLWIKENHKTGIVLTGRPFHGDVQIHKGVPYMAETLGAAVLSGEGLALLEKDRLPGGARSSSLPAAESLRKSDPGTRFGTRSAAFRQLRLG